MSRNDELFERAQQSIPAGVNSPVRAFRSVGGTPRFIERGEGPYVWDADGARYIDYVGSWGPAIVGHAEPSVVRAVQQRVQSGLSFGAPTELEIEMAETLCRRMPSIELVRLVSSGTEAALSALRLARGSTGRSADIVASVPDDTNRTSSIDGIRRHSVSAISISSSVGAPNDSPDCTRCCTCLLYTSPSPRDRQK